MNTTARTDIHRPSAPEFDPEAYEFYGAYDLQSDGGDGGRVRMVNVLLDGGYRFGGSTAGTCGHCGARARYVALIAREDVKEMIYVGETCLDNRFSGSKADFLRLREAAKGQRIRNAKQMQINAAVDAHPALAWLTYPQYTDGTNTFIADIGYKFRRYGELSERQIAAAIRVMEEDVKRAAEVEARKAAQDALAKSGVEVPEGRVTVTGKIVSLKWKESEWGGSLKMVVRTAEGWAVWGTCPKSLDDAEVGDMVSFVGTIEKSATDPLFGFFKNPSKAEVVADV